MNQDTSLPADADAQNEQSEGVKLYASLNSLAVDGVAPQVGDQVSLDVTGTVQSLEGEKACIRPDTVNGEPVEAPAEKSLRDQAYESMAANDQGSY